MALTFESGSTGPTAANGRNTALGLGCAALFLLPFAGFGIFAANLAAEKAAQGNWREALYALLFTVVFGGVGFGGLVALVVGKGKVNEQDALKARHPDQPWLWQPDWASGRVADTTRIALWMSWIFAALWNLVSIPLGFVGVRAALHEGNPAGLIALLFPLAGVGILVWAIRCAIRYRKYGSSVFELSTLPGVIGHTLAGNVRISTVLRPEEGFQVSLTCVHRVTTGSGKNSSTSETILWQEESSVRGETIRDAAGFGTRIPLAFRLPADCRASDASNLNDRILWRLKLSAGMPGVDYESVFEVPVFRTAASNQPLSDAEERVTHSQLVAPDYRPPIDSRITVTRNRRGTEIVFPPARNPGAATGGTVFTLIWLAIVWFLAWSRAPLLFPIVFALFGLILIYGTLQLWLGVSRVTVDAGTVVVASGYLSPGQERRLTASEIADVSTSIGMQAGSRPYYDVVILGKDGKKIIAGRSVRDKREAEWLAMTIKSAAGVESRPIAA